jgi:hypothetical protein
LGFPPRLRLVAVSLTLLPRRVYEDRETDLSKKPASHRLTFPSGQRQEKVMKRLTVALAAVAGVFLAATPLLACGDKFVVLGRGVRFQHVHAAKHPASILVYMNPGSRVAQAEKEFQLQAMLKLAGHKPVAVEGASLAQALSSKSYDVVLADLGDAATLEQEVTSVPSKPVVVPVLYNPTKADLAAAEEKYSCVLAASKKNRNLLDVVDEVMSSRHRGEEAKCMRKL